MTLFNQKIETLLDEDAPDFEISKFLKESYASYLKSLEATFQQTQGKAFLVHHTRKIDLFLSTIYKVVLRKMFGNFQPMRNTIPIALVALGSYGREQLCVHSDIDLMIVYSDTPGYNIKEIIEKILYIAWDGGFHLGHRVHEVSELPDVAETDITIKTALLESRFIIGSNFIWMQTQRQLGYIRKQKAGEYIRAKIAEGKKRWARHPLSMEPNIKECPGGMRDANLAFWLASVRYNSSKLRELVGDVIVEADYIEYRSALEFIFRVRAALHLAAGKKEDTLRFDLIPSVASLMGLHKDSAQKAQVELVRRTFHALDNIRRKSTYWQGLFAKPYLYEPSHITPLRDGCIEPGIFRCKNTLYAKREMDAKTIGHYIKLLTKEAQNIPFKTDASFNHLIDHTSVPKTKGKQLVATIRQVFYTNYSASVVEALYAGGKLKETISPLKRIIHLAQLDGYHQLPVDLHSIRTLEFLDQLNQPFFKSKFQALDRESRAMLKLVALLHDAGKGRTRDHHIVGSNLFKAYATKLGFTPALIKEGMVLILHHTRMTSTIHNQDIYNESTVSKFVAPLKSRKILDMLFILTYCDINAVGKGTYNAFTDRMLKTLYRASVEILERPSIVDETVKRIRKERLLKKRAAFKALSRSMQKKIVSIESNLFFIKHSPEEIIDIALRAFEVRDYALFIDSKDTLRIEIFRKVPINLGYLLGKLSYLELVNMEIFKLFDQIKYFILEFSDKIEDDEIPLLQEIVHNAFDMEKEIRLTKPAIKPGEITIDCNHSQSYATMHIRTSNQRGLMAYVAHEFDKEGVDIASAVITTSKRRVNDFFLIEKSGNFCGKKEALLKKLLNS